MSILEQKHIDARISRRGPEASLEMLLTKYSLSPKCGWRLSRTEPTFRTIDGENAYTFIPGDVCLRSSLGEGVFPLFPWRSERRFVELKRLVESRTIEPLLMCRFAFQSDGKAMSLDGILYREYDLAEWLCGSTVKHLYATLNAGRSANVVARMENDVLFSIEAGTSLPPGLPVQDKHELIARRGIASDRAVDTQIAQSSIYAFTASGTHEYTDTDAELFGLDAQETLLVRSAFAALSHSSDVDAARDRHVHLQELVSLTWESDRLRRRMFVKGAAQ